MAGEGQMNFAGMCIISFGYVNSVFLTQVISRRQKWNLR